MEPYMTKNEFRRKIQGVYISGQVIPFYMYDGLEQYVFDGARPGSFLCAVLENDLVKAASRADDKNMQCLAAWASLLYNVMPCRSWGSRKAIDAWVESRKKNTEED